MGLDFKGYDVVGIKEEQIQQMIYRPSKANTNIPQLAKHIVQKKDMMCVLTLLSIFFKEKSRAIFVQEKLELSKEDEQDTIDIAEELICTFILPIAGNDIDKIQELMKKYMELIDIILFQYYSLKNTNYIFKQMPIEIIKKQTKQKELLSLNPFMINQLMNNEQKPLTEEEKIIYELIEYLIEAEQYYDNDKKIDYVKKLLEMNTPQDELEDKIRFIISNTYQEAKEHPSHEDSDDIIRSIEKTLITEDIVSYFKKNRDISNMFIRNFLEYNLRINEGRLNELENKPSIEFAKRIYRKNP